MFRGLSSYDAFPKLERNIQNATRTGGFLTICVSTVLFFLIFSEFSQYRAKQQKYEFLVDAGSLNTAKESRIQINVDMTIAMNCTAIRADVLDVAGSSLHFGGQNGFILEPATFETDMRRYNSVRKGGRDIDIGRLLDEADRIRNFKQGSSKNLKDSGGCRITGSVYVNKVSGMLHFTALGHGYAGSEHADHNAMNFTHRVDHMSFGIDYPGLINPLDYTMEVAESNFEMFQYFVSIVPTIFIDKNRAFKSKILLTNQYAVTDYKRVIDLHSGTPGIPGIFIKYDIEPILVRVTEYRTSFMHFLTRLCGIVGGNYKYSYSVLSDGSSLQLDWCTAYCHDFYDYK
ncbi:hypothetical protein HDU76_009611, partial [Blyttiomyces sp. JEL0837]